MITLITWAQKVPFPYIKFPVRVHQTTLYAQTLDRWVALILWKLGLLEQFEYALIQKLCRPAMMVVDIGANIGFHTLQLAQAVGAEGQVWAFEPDPSNFKTLLLNLRANHASNVTAVDAAVGAKSEMISLYQSNVHHGDHRIYPTRDVERNCISIQALALDEYFDAFQKIDLIKMDIQGAEGLALSGMKNLLARNPNLSIFMEFWPAGIRQTGYSPLSLLTELADRGYRVFEIKENEKRLSPVRDFADFISSISGENYCNILVSRTAPDNMAVA